MSFQIAIDGPVAAGKGTVSRLVSQRLGFLYIDTGAMYRVAALIAQRHGVSWEDEAGIANLVKDINIEMRNPNNGEMDGRLVTVLVDGEDVSWKIRTEKMGDGASRVSVFPKVREVLVAKQQQIAQNYDVVMEGRDITHKVLPNADLKIYLTASEMSRARRRHLQLLTKGLDMSYEEVYQDLLVRDERDKNRETDPLQIVDDALVIDTSDLSIEKVVEMIVKKVELMRS